MVRGRRNPLHYGLPERLAQARQAASLARRTLDQHAGLANGVVQRIEDRETIPLLDTAERLALALGVPPGWLVYGALGDRPFRDKVPRAQQSTEAPVPAPRRVPADEPLRCAGIGARLATARAQAGLSKKALAEAAQLSRGAVLYVEEGKTLPTVATAEQMAGALGVAASWLAYGGLGNEEGTPPDRPHGGP